DSNCIAADALACCQAKAKEAVSKSQVAEFDESVDSHACLFVSCALDMTPETRAPLCNTTKKRCEMVAPKDIACGGHTINPHACPAGFNCTGKALLVDGTGDCKPD